MSRLNFKRCLRNFSCADTRIAQREVILSKKALRHAKPDKFKNSNAFTLAELLVSILIISVILTLLAPVITKRAKESFTVNSSAQYESRLFLYDISDSDCTDPADGTKSLNCKFTAPNDVEEISVVMVSGGGGGAGATNPTISYGQKILTSNPTIGSSQTKTLIITSSMKNIIISYLSGSGAGGGGGAYDSTSGGAPTSQADCDKYNALYIPAAYNGSGGKNLCVTKYNVGDTNGPTIASSTTTVTAGSGSCSANECCWRGTTAGPCKASGSWSGHSTSYSGCTRTVCTWAAANASCQSWAPNGTSAGDWRLPTNNEMEGWANNLSKVSNYLGSDGLQLCNTGSSYGSVRCDGNGRCYGALNGHCAPNCVWPSPSGYFFYLRDGSFNGPHSTSPSYAYSARCVLEKGAQRFNSFSGGGGAGAAFVKNLEIPKSVIESNIGGKIELFAAQGGSGGAGATSSGADAQDGQDGAASYIKIYDKNNVLKWGIEVPGGKKGMGATASNYGSGGAQVSQSSCREYNGTSWVSRNCSSYGPSGTQGASDTTGSAAQGGAGGGSAYSSTSFSQGGSGGTQTSENGMDGANYGAGGGGGTVRFVTSGTTTTPYKGKGGSGANGVAEITYDLVRQAAGGGGGGGGAFIRVEKIKVTSGKEYTIKVASGGAAGSVATKGSDGGVTSATFDSVTYTLSGGKGGQIGTSSTDTSNVIQGIGGLGGIVSSNVSDTTNIEYKNGLKGDDGNTYTTTTGFVVSNGGNGGTSGLDTKGGCGGLFIDSSICTNTNVNGTSVNFVSPNQIFDTAQYGSAGAGGGGGGWSEDTFNYPNSGGGSQGQGGYVYINWVKYKS